MEAVRFFENFQDCRDSLPVILCYQLKKLVIFMAFKNSPEKKTKCILKITIVSSQMAKFHY